MKKKNLYISPGTDMVFVQTQQFFATSGTVDGNSSLTPDPDPTPGDPANDGKSRKYDIWTDPEEEEDDQW